MTKEELREHCEKQVKYCEMWAENRGQKPSGKIYEEHKLILDLIKALKQQTSDDCVSRAELLKKYEDRFIELQKARQQDKQLGVNWCINTLKDTPPVAPTQKWIPVSERLPEEETDVLICNANGDIEISRGSHSTEMKNEFIWYTSGWRFGKVIAWQPLPKPYEEKRGDSDGI